MTRGPNPITVKLSEAEQAGLDKCIRSHRSEQQVAQRARIVQGAAQGQSNTALAQQVGVHIETVRLWRKRWVDLQTIPLTELSVEARLRDEARSGSPGKFSAEQIAHLIALACEKPEASGYPGSHWTPQALVHEAVKRGIVVSISERQMGRFLKRGGLEAPSESLLAQHHRERPPGL